MFHRIAALAVLLAAPFAASAGEIEIADGDVTISTAKAKQMNGVSRAFIGDFNVTFQLVEAEGARAGQLLEDKSDVTVTLAARLEGIDEARMAAISEGIHKVFVAEAQKAGFTDLVATSDLAGAKAYKKYTVEPGGEVEEKRKGKTVVHKTVRPGGAVTLLNKKGKAASDIMRQTAHGKASSELDAVWIDVNLSFSFADFSKKSGVLREQAEVKMVPALGLLGGLGETQTVFRYGYTSNAYHSVEGDGIRSYAPIGEAREAGDRTIDLGPVASTVSTVVVEADPEAFEAAAIELARSYFARVFADLRAKTDR